MSYQDTDMCSAPVFGREQMPRYGMELGLDVRGHGVQSQWHHSPGWRHPVRDSLKSLQLYHKAAPSLPHSRGLRSRISAACLHSLSKLGAWHAGLNGRSHSPVTADSEGRGGTMDEGVTAMVNHHPVQGDIGKMV